MADFNTSKVTGATVQDTNGTTTQEVTILSTAQATLGVSITPNVANVLKGNSFYYTVTVTNQSSTNDITEPLTFTDTIDTNSLTYVSSTVNGTPNTLTFNNGVLSGAIGTLGKSAVTTIIINVTAKA